MRPGNVVKSRLLLSFLQKIASSSKNICFCFKRDHLSTPNILVLCFSLKQHIFARGNSLSENAKANTDAATINMNFMPDFEQKIQQCYLNQFLVTKDMWKKNFHRNCVQCNNLSWFVTKLTWAKTNLLQWILNCRHFGAVCFYGINIHEKISPCWLAESMSIINPKQCKILKFFECRKTKLVRKGEIECKNLKLNWLTGKSWKRNSQMANQIVCFQIKRTLWMAQFMVQFFPDSVIGVRSFCSTISKFFHQSAWRNFLMCIINR